jgi:hypothetical protein
MQRYRVKSSNFWDAVSAGAANYFLHIDQGFTGRVTISPGTNDPSVTTTQKCVILQSVTVNNTSSSGTLIVSDSLQGILAALKTSVQEKDYHYTVLIRGNLTLDANQGDYTIVYARD